MKFTKSICTIFSFVIAAGFALQSDSPSGFEARGEQPGAPDRTTYRSPFDLAVSPDGQTVFATDRTAGSVAVLDAAELSRRGEIAVRGRPEGLALSADGDVLYVAEHGAGTVAVIDTERGEVTSRIQVGKWPKAIAVADESKRLYVCNQDDHTVSVIDLSQTPARQLQRIAVIREPSDVAVTPDERRVVVANLLPHGVGVNPKLSAEVSILDASTTTQAATVKLPPGSSMVRGLDVSPDGKWAYVVHGLGRFNLPITQLERGWVNTFALSIIEVAAARRVATVLLDDLTQGAADPHSVVCSKDGERLSISHTGVHEVSFIDVGLLHALLEGDIPDEVASLTDGGQPNIWVKIGQDREQVAELANDLTALYIAGAIRRAKSGGKGPRGLALAPDGQTLFVANYYSGTVAVLDASSGSRLGEMSMGQQPEADAVRRGELIFHDATKAFQRWHSCASCHANEGRVDGLRWDFLADGMGNAKDTMSLVHLHRTEPMNRRGTVQSAKDCIRNGLQSTNMLVPTEQEVEDLWAYCTSLEPVPSPHLTEDGRLTEQAQRGKALFEGKAACAGCHRGPDFTDNKMRNVGVLSASEPDGRYNTPSLLEAYRTAPYLHDGRALTLKKVFTVHNEKGRHGKTDSLTEQELDELVAYLLSL